MSIGAAIVVAATGAILKFAVADSVDGVDLGTVGLILMIAGAVGALFEVVRLGALSKNERHTERVVEESGAPARHEEVHERYS